MEAPGGSAPLPQDHHQIVAQAMDFELQAGTSTAPLLLTEHATADQKIKKHGKWYWPFLIVLFLLVGFLATSAVTYGYRGYALYNLSKKVQSDLVALQGLAGDPNPDFVVITKAAILTKGTKKDLEQVQSGLTTLGFLRYIPIARTQFLAVEKTVSASWQVVTAANEVLVGAESVVAPLGTKKIDNFSQLTPETKKTILENLNHMTPVLAGATQELDLAQLQLDQVPQYGVLRQIQEQVNRIDRALPAAREGIALATTASKTLPVLAGYPQDRRYLFLFLNNAELRPGGGFIGSIGTVTLSAGDIKEFKTSDSYDLDSKYNSTIPAPAPLATLYPYWFLRNANWSPDFPTSAATSYDFYVKESGDQNIQGVIGMTPEVTKAFLGLTGPLQVPGYPYTFTPENFTLTLDTIVEKDFNKFGIPYEDRKKILGQLSETILNRVFALPREQWGQLATVLNTSIKEKQLMIWYKGGDGTSPQDKEIAQVLRDGHLDGHMEPTDHDFLMVVDANLGGLKSDLFIKRDLSYSVQWTNDNKLMARAVMHYDHTGFYDFFSGRYPTYVRFYVPDGSKLTGQQGCDTQFLEEKDLGHTVFGCFKNVHPQTEASVVAEYQLPDSIAAQVAAGNYDLSVEKQLGASNNALSIRFQSKSPIAKTVPEGAIKESNQQVHWQTVLDVDKSFHIGL